MRISEAPWACFVEALDETGQVHLRATRRECTGHRKENDFALAEHLGGADGLGHSVVTKQVNLDIGNLGSG
jgi:hypothetical protein